MCVILISTNKLDQSIWMVQEYVWLVGGSPSKCDVSGLNFEDPGRIATTTILVLV